MTRPSQTNGEHNHLSTSIALTEDGRSTELSLESLSETLCVEMFFLSSLFREFVIRSGGVPALVSEDRRCVRLSWRYRRITWARFSLMEEFESTK